jgi:hypothetical protein
MGDNFLDDPSQIRVHTDWIIAVDAGDQVGALPDVDTVFVTPFNPLVIGISRLHESAPTLSGSAFPDRAWRRRPLVR